MHYIMCKGLHNDVVQPTNEIVPRHLFPLLKRLLQGLSTVMCSNKSCLGEPWCSEWGCCEMEPPPKKAKRDSSPEAGSRFPSPKSSPKMSEICKG